jgi:hypothetical protein
VASFHNKNNRVACLKFLKILDETLKNVFNHFDHEFGMSLFFFSFLNEKAAYQPWRRGIVVIASAS